MGVAAVRAATRADAAALARIHVDVWCSEFARIPAIVRGAGVVECGFVFDEP